MRGGNVRISTPISPNIGFPFKGNFDGGGHKNAAGGKSYVSMDETIAHYIRSVEEFACEGGLDTPPLR